MIVHLSTSGGIGGFGLGKEARVDVDALDTSLKTEVCAAMTPEELARLAAAKVEVGADRIVYRITLEDSDGTAQSFEINEAALPDELIDLIDTLYHEAGKARK